MIYHIFEEYDEKKDDYSWKLICGFVIDYAAIVLSGSVYARRRKRDTKCF